MFPCLDSVDGGWPSCMIYLSLFSSTQSHFYVVHVFVPPSFGLSPHVLRTLVTILTFLGFYTSTCAYFSKLLSISIPERVGYHQYFSARTRWGISEMPARTVALLTESDERRPPGKRVAGRRRRLVRYRP